MQQHTNTLLHCGGVGFVGLLMAYVLQLMPVEDRLKQVVSVGIAVVSLVMMLRIGGVL